MSIYSTLNVRKKDAWRILADEFNVDWDSGATEEQMIERILFAVTSNNGHSPLKWNNFCIVPDDYQREDEWDRLYEPFSL